MQNKKVAVIGSGAMGSALAKVVFDHGNTDVFVYGIDEKEVSDLNKGVNTKYFPVNVNIPITKATLDLKEALTEVDYIVLAVPSKFMDSVIDNILDVLDNDALIINGSKGFYPGTMMSLHEGIEAQTKDNKFIKGVVSLIGPSHAEQIVLEKPTIVASVSDVVELADEVRNLFVSPYFRTYIQTDVKGSEVGAAYKNVLAIAAGLSEEIGNGINTLAALLTRGIAEMARYNEFQGGEPDTIMGLTGLGDLIVTATSDLSRNFTFGREFIRKGTEALDTNITVEGLTAIKYITKIAKKNDIHLPIVTTLYSVLYEGWDVNDTIEALWASGSKFE